MTRAFRDRLRQVRVEVVGAADAGVRRQRARGQIVRDLGEEAAPVGEDLRPPVTENVVGGANARRPVVLQREVVPTERADQRLLLVADARLDGQPIADSKRVLREEAGVVLPRAAAGIRLARVTR